MSLEYPTPGQRNTYVQKPDIYAIARLEDLKPIIDEVNRIADAPVTSALEYISNTPVNQNYPTGGTQTFNLPITKNGNYLVTVHGTYRQNGVSTGNCFHTIDRTGSNGPRQYVVVPITTEVSIFNQRLVTITDFNTQTIDFNFNGASNDCSLLNVVVSALIL